MADMTQYSSKKVTEQILGKEDINNTVIDELQFANSRVVHVKSQLFRLDRVTLELVLGEGGTVTFD